MVQRYTHDELLSLESHAVLPAGVDLQPFLDLIEKVQEAMAEFEETHPRRKSFTHPKKKRAPKEIKHVDDDGWTSFVPTKKITEDTTDAVIEDDDDGFTPAPSSNSKAGKQHTIFKSSSSKISSGKAGIADSRDTVATTQTSKFNAFDALNDDDDE